MVIFYKKWKKYNEIQLTKKQNGLRCSKNDKSSTLPGTNSTTAYSKLYGIFNFKSNFFKMNKIGCPEKM